MNYLQKRVYEQIGITEEQNRMMVKFEGMYGIVHEEPMQIFSSDEKDNIRILVTDLRRNVITYEDPNVRQTDRHSDLDRTKTYYVTRVNPENLHDDMPKYLFPKGQGNYPFFPPSLIDKWERRDRIPMLILTEGYFKAFTASLYGLDVVGLGSITLYADSQTKRLHKDIRTIIQDCGVQTVCILYDGDCRNISTKDLERKAELTRRPRVFMNALVNTRELLLDLDVNIYFAHVDSTDLENEPKGLDDLLLDPAHRQNADAIVEDLRNLHKGGDYFYKMNLKGSVQKLQIYFNLKSVEQFYQAWQPIIGASEFVYNGSTYKFNSDKNELQRLVPKELKNYIRVGDDYYERIRIVSMRSNREEYRLAPRKKGTIKDDFGGDKLQYIPKYKAFINYPSHTDYRPIIEDNYNLYSPLNYTPEEGDWRHIDMMMHHIFEEQYELGMDYMQLLYQHPEQMLPILCLVSRENITGKTTFLDLLREIYGNNAVIVGNSEISSEFNAMVSGRLIVGVDETALDDNAKVTERIKMQATAKRLPMQRKGKDHEEIDNFTKYVLCSNNETKFVYTKQDEIRFWVRKIKTIPQDQMITDLDERMFAEIPAFLYFLNNRKMHVQKRLTRMWFTPEQIETTALTALRDEQLPNAVKDIRNALRDMFSNFPADKYLLSIKTIKFLCESVGRVNDAIIRGYLRDYLRAKDAGSGVKYIKIPMLGASEEYPVEYHVDRGHGFYISADAVLAPKDLQRNNDILAGTYINDPDEVIYINNGAYYTRYTAR